MFTVFTPTNCADRLHDLYESLLEQTVQDWEWIVVPNGGVQLPELTDPRVRVIPYESDSIGALKRFACDHGVGEWLIELDHDDLLLPRALERIGESKADFVYSDTLRVDMDWNSLHFEGDGWESYPYTYQGHTVQAVSAPDYWPSNFSRIWYAPDHVRAWRRSFYQHIGGHNPALSEGDDHDLVCRTTIFGTIEHIREPLYVYRVHGENSWLKRQAQIDRIQWQNHDAYFLPLYEKWAKDNDLKCIDLGGALQPAGGPYLSVDRHNADICCDLESEWPFVTGEIGVIRAHDVMEHLSPLHAMNEAYRVLSHGGLLDILVPSTRGEGAWCDPTHKSFWNKRSFRYYTEWNMRKFLEPECQCAFQIVRVEDTMMWEDIPYVRAELMAVKDGPRIHGPLSI